MLSLTSPGENASLKSDATNDVHIVHHRDADRDALLAALAQLDPDAGLAAIVAALGGKATDAGLAAIVAALGGTLAVSADSLPLPAGAATQATLASILAKIITAPATEAKQDTLIGFVDGIETALAGVLAKIIVAPATEAKQDATNTALGALATQTTLAAVLAKMISAPATEAKQDAIIAKLIAAPATEVKQDALKASVDALFNAMKPLTGHFTVVPSGSTLANTTRRIVAGAAGTLTCTLTTGGSVSYTVVAGQQLDVAATVISAAPAGTVGQF